MDRKVKTRTNLMTIMLVPMLLAACASSDDIRQPPSYAIRDTVDTFRVSCDEDSSPRSVYVRYDSLDVFFHPDGSEKSQDEFCRESPFGWINR